MIQRGVASATGAARRKPAGIHTAGIHTAGIHTGGLTPRRSGGRRGAAIVEFAVLLPVVVSLLIGVWEIGRVTNVQDILTNAAREGARQAATGQVTNAQVQQVVIRYLASAGLPTGNVVVSVQDLTNPANDVSAAQYLDRIQVTVTIPFGDVRWATPSFFVSPTTLLTAQVQWGTMVDKAYPNPPQPPAG